MNINHQCWRFPALLERREGIDQPTRRGSNADIRAELRKLLGITDTPTKEACIPTGCAVPVASEETGMDSLIDSCAQQGLAGQRKSPTVVASTMTMPAGQGQPAGALKGATGASKMKCPRCGGPCERDMVDVGVGEIPCGAWGCPDCEWVEPNEPPDSAERPKGAGAWNPRNVACRPSNSQDGAK